MIAIFVTATGTDIGKTFVTAGLIRHLRDQGRVVLAFKPIVSGFDPVNLETSDPGILLAALGRRITENEIDKISPWRFSAPLSPDMAARQEHRLVDFGAVVAFSRKAIAGDYDVLMIEGVGGIMVPLDDQHTVLDWMTALHVPVILVAGSYLGTISHTLSALKVLARHGLTVLSLVVSESEGGHVPLAETVKTIRRFSSPVEVIGLPRIQGSLPGNSGFRQLVRLFDTGSPKA